MSLACWATSRASALRSTLGSGAKWTWMSTESSISLSIAAKTSPYQRIPGVGIAASGDGKAPGRKLGLG